MPKLALGLLLAAMIAGLCLLLFDAAQGDHPTTPAASAPEESRKPEESRELQEPPALSAVRDSEARRSRADGAAQATAPLVAASPSEAWPRLMVRVADEAGRPIPEAVLRVEGRALPAGVERGAFTVHDPRVQSASVAVDADGWAEVTVPTIEVVRVLVRAEASGYVPVSRLVAVDDAAEPLILVLGTGPYVTGRVVDRNGDPVLSLSYKLLPAEVDPSQRPSEWAKPDREGRFALGAEQAGPHLFVLWNEDHGRSPELEVMLQSSGEHDLGEIALLGDGQLGGRLVLGDGSALTRSSVRATLVGESSGPGLRGGRTKPDASGAFLIERLAPGLYLLSNGWDDSLPIDNPGPYPTGELDLKLRVDAHQIRVEARDDEDQVVPLTQLRRAWLGEHGASSASRRFPEPATSSEFSVAAGKEVRLAGTGVDGERYLGVVPSTWPSGTHELTLRRSVASLARLVVRASSEALSPDAGLSMTGLTGPRVSEFGAPQAAASGPVDGLLELVLDGLDPGPVEASFLLRSEGYVGLARKTYSVELMGGETAVLDLDLVLGGRIAISLESGQESGGERRGALVSVLSPGDPEWQWIDLETKQYDDNGEVIGWSFGSQAWFDDEPAVSAPIAPGVYSIRIEEQAILPYEQTVEVSAGETLELTVRPTAR